MQRDMDDFDRTFIDNDTLVPSSGFSARVMDAVRDEAAEPPPLPFPWRPFVIGVLACVVWAASAIQVMTRLDRGIVQDMALPLVEAGKMPLYLAAAVLGALIVLALKRTVIR